MVRTPANASATADFAWFWRTDFPGAKAFGGIDMRKGTYRGSVGSTAIEMRLDWDAARQSLVFSGDANSPQTSIYFIGSSTPVRQNPGGDFSSTVSVLQDRVWRDGFAQLSFDQSRQTCKIRILVLGYQVLLGTCRFQYSTLRKLSVTIFAEEQVATDGQVRTHLWPRYSDTQAVRSSFEASDVGLEFLYGAPLQRPAGQTIGWRTSELDDLLRSLARVGGFASAPNPNYILMSVGQHESHGMIGLMFDESDGFPRQGCAIFADHPYLNPPSETARRLRNTWAISHEIGHCLNLLHTFDPASGDAQRERSMSWMNYPYIYDGLYGNRSGDFWSRFDHCFREHEALFLQHGSLLDLFAGGRAFGGSRTTFPSGAAIFESANGRDDLDGKIALDPLEDHELADPVYVRFSLPPILVQQGASVESGAIAIMISSPDGSVRRFKPSSTECYRPTPVKEAHASEYRLHFIGSGGHGHYFLNPGVYKICILGKTSDGVSVASNIQSLKVLPSSKTNHEIDFLLSRPAQRTLEYGDVCGTDSLDDFKERITSLQSAPARVALLLAVGLTLQRDQNKFDALGARVFVQPAAPQKSIAALDQALSNIARNLKRFQKSAFPAMVAQTKNLQLCGETERARKLVECIRLARSEKWSEVTGAILQARKVTQPLVQ
ncbi:hypothetical protein K3720_00435 [Leisingera caerulea]|uniref:hypothetical protein n=1 Tax=Leisingera caerulea TaxID=506591 RepID=UPI0021A423AF|nr:hypothetical protein [Leisingera caerulea]UWQ49915.1 hypothetical protein K3720_00435 [Leisingera caerulea]